jgi:protein-ribulosamine 3-kinase
LLFVFDLHSTDPVVLVSMSTAIHEFLQAGDDAPGSLPVAGNFPVDENVVAKLPEGARIVSADRHGTSAWTVTARLLVELPDGENQRYFLKCASDEAGRRLMEGEFHAMSELYKAMPNMVPKPHAWGRYAVKTPETYFFLQEYIEMSDRVPAPDQLCKKLALLHRNSVSPTGKFGFHVNTCQGRIQQDVGWEESWAKLFEKMLKHVIQQDFSVNGYWEEMDILEQRLLGHVVPRLIGAMERDGRLIKPSLIHADLWEGNTGTSIDTGDIYIFDAAAFYAHNEMEIGTAAMFLVHLPGDEPISPDPC